jgi:lysophospholipid acyltransferase
MQHGIAPGYYITFVLGGFMTTLGRMLRQYVRPLVLPAPAAPPAPGSKPPPPPQTLLKRAYDALGTLVTLLVLNFATAPFLVLTASGSFTIWARVNYYGLWMVGGGLAFFYAGGSAWLRGVQAARMKGAAAHVKVERDAVVGLPPLDAAIHEVQTEVGRAVKEVVGRKEK